MTRRQKRLAGVLLLASGVAVAAALMLTAFRKNLMNFYTPSDLAALEAGASAARMRLGGMVEGGSLRRGEGLRVEFILADCAARVPVRYEGILPDLFREGQGIVASGHLAPAGGGALVFVADEVLAKHDENYMPPQMAEAMLKPDGTACAPFKSVTQPG